MQIFYIVVGKTEIGSVIFSGNISDKSTNQPESSITFTLLFGFKPK